MYSLVGTADTKQYRITVHWKQHLSGVRDNTNELWSLLESYQRTHSRHGVNVSVNTLKAYKRGLTLLMDFCASQGIQPHQ